VTPHAVVVTSNNPTKVSAFDPTTGAPRWTASPAGTVLEPTAADNLVFVGHIQSAPTVGALIYDLTTGAFVTSSPTLCCGPIPTEGHIIGSGLNGLQAMVPSPSPST
jgi:hypothetical protein